MHHRVFADQRVGLFVDVQNMYYSARKQYGKKLNFETLLDKAVKGRKLIRAIAYIVQSPEIDNERFVETLKALGFEIRSKELKTRVDGSIKGDWDVAMAIEIQKIAKNLDVVVLVSGDGDFSSLICSLYSEGKKVEIMAFPRSAAKELVEKVHFEYNANFHPIEESWLI
jgi:uncharacterized LabA/DUF88 family protein